MIDRPHTADDREPVAAAATGSAPGRIGALTFAKQFPNAAEPLRGVFVAEQVEATRGAVDWAVVAPVPWVPKVVARLLGKPYVRGAGDADGVTVLHPRYPVLPRRIGYATVAPLIAFTARGAFTRACDEVGARIVHVHDLYPSGAAARRLCARAGIPYVLTVHGSDLYSNMANPRWRAEITAAALGARALICVGSRLARDCVELLGVDPTRTLVIPNTYDAGRFAFIERLPHDGPPRLLCVGRLSPEKGHEVLLRAIAQLLARGVHVTLEIVGDGKQRGSLEQLSRELSCDGHIRFAGQATGDEIVSAMARADAFVLPSLSEGFGVALIEALATGLPAIATRSGGPEDILSPDDGLLIAPGDPTALAEGVMVLMEAIGRYDRRAIASRAAERYAPRLVGDRLVRLYTEILNGVAPSGAFSEDVGHE